jgi:hypothetical protein
MYSYRYILYTLTLACLQTSTQQYVNAFDKYLQYSSVKSLGVYVNDLHLHRIYRLYVWLFTISHTMLSQMMPWEWYTMQHEF